MIISSRPPEVVGHFDSSGMSPITDGMNADVELVVAGSEATYENEAHRRFTQYEILKDELEPLWSAVDQDFRNTNDIDPDEPVNHIITIRNDRTELPRVFSRDEAMGISLHVDAAVKDVETTRYVMHSTNPTVFLLGEKWFLPVPVEKLPKQRFLGVASYLVGHVVNGVALAQQSRRGLVYQPLPGEIVKIERQVHASPEGRSRGEDSGKLIVVESYIAQ